LLSEDIARDFFSRVVAIADSKRPWRALVVGESKARRQAVKTALEGFKKRKVNILGAILNNRVFPIQKFVYDSV
jgi:Mrp family chromosome partitioning ATPase